MLIGWESTLRSARWLATGVASWMSSANNTRLVAGTRRALAEAKRRLEEQLAVEVAANAAYEAYRRAAG